MWETFNFRDPPADGPILSPKNIARFLGPRQDRGPVAIGDVSQGLEDYVWEMVWDEGFWSIFRVDQGIETKMQMVDTQSSEELLYYDITFDTAGRPFLVWEQDGSVLMYWYNPTQSDFVTSTLVEGGLNPFCTLDYRNRYQLQYSDIIVIYELNDAVRFRIGSDRFGTEYDTPEHALQGRRIKRAGVATNHRYVFEIQEM